LAGFDDARPHLPTSRIAIPASQVNARSLLATRLPSRCGAVPTESAERKHLLHLPRSPPRLRVRRGQGCGGAPPPRQGIPAARYLAVVHGLERETLTWGFGH